MSDNLTNEQIVDEAMSVQWGRGGWFAGAVVTALEAAGRLVAAQGAAPVLPSSGVSPAQAFTDWHEHWWQNEPNTLQKANAQAAFFAGWDARGTVSALPSSGVDETALAEVIRRADAEWQAREARLETASKLTHAQYVARAVAEWLKGQGR